VNDFAADEALVKTTLVLCFRDENNNKVEDSKDGIN